jgi:hypothetical protein
MTRPQLLVIATAGILGSFAVATTTFHQPANAQAFQARVFAERACLDYGIAPSTTATKAVSPAPRAPTVASPISPTCMPRDARARRLA